MQDTMVDSYLAPADLTEARRIAEEAANAVTGLGGHQPSHDAVMRLTTEPFELQQQLMTAETQCVMADFVLWSWDKASLSRLANALRPDRTLVFVEPTAELGWRQIVHRMGRPAWRRFLGYDFHTDVPAALREAGLTVTTTNRFGSGPAQIRSYVVGQAKHYENF